MEMKKGMTECEAGLVIPCFSCPPCKAKQKQWWNKGKTINLYVLINREIPL